MLALLILKNEYGPQYTLRNQGPTILGSFFKEQTMVSTLTMDLDSILGKVKREYMNYYSSPAQYPASIIIFPDGEVITSVYACAPGIPSDEYYNEVPHSLSLLNLIVKDYPEEDSWDLADEAWDNSIDEDEIRDEIRIWAESGNLIKD